MKQAEVAILISDKIYFKPKLIGRARGHYKLIKKNLPMYIAIFNICVPNTRVLKFLKETPL